MFVNSYQELDVWKRGRVIAGLAYELTRGFPKDELFAMTSQIRRSATSIPANIAEGWGRHYPAEFIQFIRIANGSRTELETHLLIAADVKLTTQEAIAPLLEECQILGKQLLSLERSLRRKSAKGTE
ncbi:MAG: four helix bundle protein [Acidobacteria bacterium]|nr:four helix bundle protein [Acidobacteriota bacterium]